MNLQGEAKEWYRQNIYDAAQYSVKGFDQITFDKEDLVAFIEDLTTHLQETVHNKLLDLKIEYTHHPEKSKNNKDVLAAIDLLLGDEL